jgi:AcrR family transcriptional regulator
MNQNPGSSPDRPPTPVRERLIVTAKNLFAAKGYENTSTAEIVREAGTSESQLVKHFGGKEGLLEAIFEDGWRRLDFIFVAARAGANPAQRLRMIFELILESFHTDPCLMELMLLEGRRIRKDQSDILLTEGYARFINLVESVIQELLAASNRPLEVSSIAITSALVGTFESMLRDQLMSRRIGWKHYATDDELKKIFNLWLRAISLEIGVTQRAVGL